ncbi:IS200/IS605 family transposase (plasmid) [Bacillus cereus]|uniref:IS200/IS605 family transposase n=1 Tax=Bacillus cereus TaxID=1396 RepID=UPI001F4091DE|nr:IS200/IS605 family transposase [Bacillus cereus]UIJ69732.1 IS200/IS605 family transposase [Bacillus cereus]
MHDHLVLIVKYKRNVFDDTISNYVTDMFVRLSETYNVTLVEWHHGVDHVPILFKAHLNTEMTKFIQAYKSARSRLIKRDFPQVKKKRWKEIFWSRSFCLVTTGDATLDVVKKEIENQGEKCGGGHVESI